MHTKNYQFTEQEVKKETEEEQREEGEDKDVSLSCDWLPEDQSEAFFQQSGAEV